MAITTQNTGQTMYLLGMAISAVVNPKNKLKSFFIDEEERDAPDECCYENIVCSDGTTTLDKNDSTALFFRMADTTDTLVMKLYKDGVFKTNLTNNTYGTYYGLNTITDYTGQKFLAGYVIDWSKVYNASGYGVGSYYVVFTINGTDYTSITFTLKTFSLALLDQTVKFESYMNGEMIRNGMNFKGLNIRDCLRVKGFFGREETEQTIINDLYSRNGANRFEQVQRKVVRNTLYNLDLLPLPKCIADRIVNYHFFADKLYMSDYNSNNYSYELTRIPVYLPEAEQKEWSVTSRKVTIVAKMKEQIQDNEKRNYF